MGRKTRNQGQPDRRALEEKTATKNHMTVDSETDGEAELAKPGRLIHIGKWRFRLPQSRFLRLLIGIGFIVGGILGFLPILGFWMIPLGLLILSNDVPLIRRWRRRLVVWFVKSRRNKNPQGNGVD